MRTASEHLTCVQKVLKNDSKTGKIKSKNLYYFSYSDLFTVQNIPMIQSMDYTGSDTISDKGKTYTWNMLDFLIFINKMQTFMELLCAFLGLTFLQVTKYFRTKIKIPVTKNGLKSTTFHS